MLVVTGNLVLQTNSGRLKHTYTIACYGRTLSSLLLVAAELLNVVNMCLGWEVLAFSYFCLTMGLTENRIVVPIVWMS